jgi:MFS family permease
LPPGVLHQKPFALFWTSRIFTILAFQMLSVGVGWEIYSITGSAFYLGLVGLAQFLPMFLLTLVVGYISDRVDRRSIVFVCQWIEAVSASALALGTFVNWLDKNSILAIIFILGSARAFEGPGMQALMPKLVAPADFPRAAALTASASQSAILIGPALGGFLFACGPGIVYVAAGLLFFVAGILVWLIHHHRTPAKGRATMRSIFAGIAYIRNHPVILGSISLDLFAVLLGGATALLPIFARDILHAGPMGLGLLRSAPALGAVAMTIYLARSPIRRRVGRTMLIAVAVFGLATIVFSLSTSFALSLVMLIAAGAADAISVVIRISIVQLGTPDEMRGRVSAVNSLFIGTSNQLGEFESGVTASLFGTVPAVLIGGIGTLAVVASWIWLFPQLARKDRLET